MKIHWTKIFISVNVMLAVVLVNISCKKSGGGNKISTEQATVNYIESADDFANPERGFYRYTETRASNYTPLAQSQLQQWRGLTNADGGNYQVYSTLVFRYFVMDIFKTAPLSAAFLTAVKNDFDIARAAGIKLIPRFVYTTTATSGGCPEGFICPPYGDATKAVVLNHIAQLKPVLMQSADVIAVMQLGFIGTWGEGYYTDYFGDPSQNGQSKLLNNNWQDRGEVLSALLDALPTDRMVQVRYPQAKQRAIYGIQSTVNVPALLETEAFDGTNKARTGFHNDCFLASADDYGTYEDYGNSSSPRQGALAVLKAYKKADSKYVAVGGETCDDTYSPQNDCEPAGAAETEMRSLHYSYLNCAYNNAVNNDWQTAGCMMNIRKNLGYRFVLQQMVHSKEVAVGGNLTIALTINNAGYAAPFNERPVKAVLRNKANNTVHVIDVPTDVRKWYSGMNKVEASLSLPATIEAGTYELLLSLPDKYPSIAPRPEYAIRLANEGLWETATGFNKLNTEVMVK